MFKQHSYNVESLLFISSSLPPPQEFILCITTATNKLPLRPITSHSLASSMPTNSPAHHELPPRTITSSAPYKLPVRLITFPAHHRHSLSSLTSTLFDFSHYTMIFNFMSSHSSHGIKITSHHYLSATPVTKHLSSHLATPTLLSTPGHAAHSHQHLSWPEPQDMQHLSFPAPHVTHHLSFP